MLRHDLLPVYPVTARCALAADTALSGIIEVRLAEFAFEPTARGSEGGLNRTRKGIQFDLGLAPMDMVEHLKRELGRAVTVGTVYNTALPAIVEIKHGCMRVLVTLPECDIGSASAGCMREDLLRGSVCSLIRCWKCSNIAFLRKEGRITGRIRRASGRGRVGRCRVGRAGAGRGLS